MNNSTGNKKDWASVKLRRDFARWLKVEAAKGDVYMGDLIEQLAERAVGGRPWRGEEGRSAIEEDVAQSKRR